MNLATLRSLVGAMTGAGGVEGFRDAAEQEVMRLGDLISAGEHAVTRLNTAPPDGGVNVMIGTMPLAQKLRLLPIMLRTMNSVTKCADAMKDDLTPTKHSATEETWNRLIELAKARGAVEVGFARISVHDIFKEYAIPYRNAIVFTIDMEKEAINTAPSYDALVEVLKTYAALGDVALALTDALREQGYGAYPGFPIGGLVDYVRVAEAAGIGAIGYHGMLISPTEGTRQRINVVFTNMETPAPAPNPHAWVLDFCAACRKCVRSCPPKAIYTTAQVSPMTGRKSTLHYQNCLDYYATHQGCAVCVKVCPFSHTGYAKIERGYRRVQARVAA